LKGGKKGKGGREVARMGLMGIRHFLVQSGKEERENREKRKGREEGRGGGT